MGRRRSWLVTALVVLLLAQLLRIAFPSIGWYLRDTVQAGTLELLPYALGPFLAALLAPVVARLLTPRWLLVGAGAGLALLRVAEQLSSVPGVDLWLSLVGVVLGLWLLPALAARPGFGLGVLVGIGADAALRGATGTLDLSWLDGVWPVVAVGAIALALIGLLLAEVLDPHPFVAPRGLRAAAHVAVGPVLLAHLLVLANQGWVATQTGWSQPAALALILVAHLLGVAVAATVRMPVTATPGGLLVMLALAGATTGGPLFAVLLMLGTVGSGLLLGHLGASPAEAGATPAAARVGVAAVGLWLALGHVLMALLALGYYIVYDLALPVGQTGIRFALAVVIGAVSLLAVGLRGHATPRAQPIGLAGLFLLAVPVAMITLTEPRAPAELDDDLRVATYNVHSAYGTDGSQDLDAIVAAIEDTDAGVVGLQEVSRGWLLNGSTDLVAVLARRLGMDHVAFHATTEDPLWGNAILSHRPLDDVRSGLLPELDTTIRRGWLAADVAVDSVEPLTFVNTHLHHAGDLETIHTAQLTELLAEVDVAENTVLVGDFNARPDYPQLDLLRDAGLVDAWDLAGDGGPGNTARADDPQYRIDWIWLSPDLNASNAEVTRSQASDHFPVSVTIGTS